MTETATGATTDDAIRLAGQRRRRSTGGAAPPNSGDTARGRGRGQSRARGQRGASPGGVTARRGGKYMHATINEPPNHAIMHAGRAGGDREIAAHAPQSWFMSPLCCAIVGRAHANIARLKDAMGAADWDNLVNTYRDCLTRHRLQVLQRLSGRIMAIPASPTPYVTQDIQEELLCIEDDGLNFNGFDEFVPLIQRIGNFTVANYHRRYEIVAPC